MHYCKYALLQIRIIVTQTVYLWALPTLNSVSQLWTLTLKTESEIISSRKKDNIVIHQKYHGMEEILNLILITCLKIFITIICLRKSF